MNRVSGDRQRVAAIEKQIENAWKSMLMTARFPHCIAIGDTFFVLEYSPEL